MKTLLRSFVGVIVVCTLGCSERIDIEAERTALLETDKAWAAAATAGDIERVTTFWTDDAINYFPGAPPATGKAGIAELVKRNRSQPGFSLGWEPTQAVVSRSGDLGYTSGTGQLSVNDAEGNSVTRRYNYVCIWKKQVDGSWKCTVEISNIGPSSDH
jgi:ketosteroid isomerase-like protein